MRKLFLAALLAAFLSVIISGCYTKFEAPLPSYGERTDTYDRDVYGDGYYYSYWGYGQYPFYCYNGWQGPFFSAYPYFGYGYFYSPWWYDPWYYYYGDDYSSRLYKKAVRSRRIDQTIYTPSTSGNAPAPSYRPSGTVKSNPPPSTGSTSGVSKPDKPKSGSSSGDSGKGTRGRR